MRILVLSNLFPPHYLGGYELICQCVVEELAARGHAVDVLASDHRVDGSPGGDEEAHVERSLLLHGFYGHPWLGIGKLKLLEEHNNRVLAEALDRSRPDLVYVWNMGGLSKSLLLTLQSRNVPTVFYLSDHWIARGLNSDVWLKWWNQSNGSLRSRSLRKVWTAAGGRKRCQAVAPTNPIQHIEFQRIYFCSESLRRSTQAAGFDVGHGAVIYCPVDTERFDSQPAPAAGPVKRLLYVGRLAEDKGVMTVLQALKFLPDRLRVELSLYGRGDAEYTDRLRQFAALHRLPVHFKSARPGQMPSIYREHDVLVFPSEWEEPFALTPLEAMASGLPVIGTTTGGSAELFRHGFNALTYRAGDAKELAAQIEEMDRNSGLRYRCAENGYDEVRRRCSKRVVVDQIEHYLAESLNQWEPVRLPHFTE